jgi:L-alanine-DL-glutamate epimerase-like enolase superfamily enzyme
MLISQIEHLELNIPFKIKFAHNSAVREKSETFVVKLLTNNGYILYGESCPRLYVTGETITSCGIFLESIKRELLKIESIKNLKDFQQKNNALIDKNPSAWCAIEIAFLDGFSKEKNISVERFFNQSEKITTKKYSAVVGIEDAWSFFKKAIKYRLMGFSDYKIKLSGKQAQDRTAIFILRALGCSQNRIRLDGNNLWDTSEKAIDYLKTLQKTFWAIEEPIKANDYLGMVEIAKVLDVKIILDESFFNIKSIDQIILSKGKLIPNIRISKMGGVFRTLEIVKILEEQGCKWILGSHVGETSLLTRAAILVETLVGTSFLIAKEGAFSTHLLTEDPFHPQLKLGFGAKIKKKIPLHAPGWGLNYNRTGDNS